jgi:hypothetical protein
MKIATLLNVVGKITLVGLGKVILVLVAIAVIIYVFARSYICDLRKEEARQNIVREINHLQETPARKSPAFIVVLLDITPSLADGLAAGSGFRSEVLDRFKKVLLKDLLPTLSIGDKIALYLIRGNCSDSNYVFGADELPSVSKPEDVGKTLGDLANIRRQGDIDALAHSDVKAILKDATNDTMKEKFQESLSGIKASIEGIAMISERGIKTDIFCAFNWIGRLQPSDHYDKRLYVFSDFKHEVRDSTLNSTWANKMVKGEWRIRLISTISNPGGGNKWTQTISAIEAALTNENGFEQQNFASIGVHDDLTEHLPLKSPLVGWENVLKAWDAYQKVECSWFPWRD